MLAPRKKILIIDDEKSYCDELQEAFKNRYTLDFCYSKNGVLNKVRSKKYKAILLDLNIDSPLDDHPDGFELLPQIKALDKKVPVLIITKLGEAELARDAFVKYGADDFIFKDKDDFEKIHEKIQQALDNQNSIPQYDMFFSYSTMDQSFVNLFIEKLQGASLKLWVDKKEIKPGHKLSKKIAEGILNSRYYLVVLSKNSINSNWVKKEYAFAEKKGKAIIPVIYGEFTLPDDIELNLPDIAKLIIPNPFEEEIQKIKEFMDPAT